MARYRGEDVLTGIGRGAVVGGTAGLTGGWAAPGVMTVFGSGTAGMFASGFVGSVASDVTAQGVELAFGLLRQRLLWFPLHPMGFAMASAYGYHLWAPFLSVWVLKTLILRLGGHTVYRRLIPLFLGIALGRYLFAGIFWGLMGVFGSPVTQSYAIHFG